MTQAYGAVWNRPEVASRYLEDRRGHVPLWGEFADLLLRLLARVPRGISRFLDVGTGDGIVAELVLDAHPGSEAVVVDNSPVMLEAAGRRLGPKTGRWRGITADLSTPDWVGALPPSSFDAVVSAFCIHHLPHERKRAVYAEIFDLLEPGGVFFNWEQVTPPAGAEDLFDALVAEKIMAVEAARGSMRSAEEIEHEYRARPDAAENRLAGVEEQADWLRDVGFAPVGVYARWIELALFGGAKPKG